PAGGARPLRLSHHLFLAGSRARPVQPGAGLDREVRVRAEGLAEDRPDLSMSGTSRRVFCLVLATAGAAGSFAPPGTIRAQAPRSGGNGTIYIGTYTKKI